VRRHGQESLSIVAAIGGDESVLGRVWSRVQRIKHCTLSGGGLAGWRRAGRRRAQQRWMIARCCGCSYPPLSMPALSNALQSLVETHCAKDWSHRSKVLRGNTSLLGTAMDCEHCDLVMGLWWRRRVRSS